MHRTIVKVSQLVAWGLLRPYVVLFTKRTVSLTPSSVGGKNIIVANHIGMLDPFIIMASLNYKVFSKLSPIKFMTANKYLNMPVLGYALLCLGCFPSKPFKKMLSGINGAERYIENDYTLFMFPEGKRKKGSEVIRLRTGASVIYNHQRPNLIASHISDASDIWRRHSVTVSSSMRYRQKSIEQIMQKVWDLK